MAAGCVLSSDSQLGGSLDPLQGRQTHGLNGLFVDRLDVEILWLRVAALCAITIDLCCCLVRVFASGGLGEGDGPLYLKNILFTPHSVKNTVFTPRSELLIFTPTPPLFTRLLSL